MSLFRTFLARSSKIIEEACLSGAQLKKYSTIRAAVAKLPAQQGPSHGVMSAVKNGSQPPVATQGFAAAVFNDSMRQMHNFTSRKIFRACQPLPKSHPFGLTGSHSVSRHCASTATTTGAAALTAGLAPSQRHALAWWLGGSSAWVFSMVVLGGVTRLTRSGLSMTDWKFTGEKPPQTEIEWEQEFSRYQLSPEYRRVNSSMNVEEFKFIYWMEWAHRMWGRGLGLAFALPAAWFAARGAINRPLARRLGLLFLMGGSQGLVGWWMVRSGLQEPQALDVPRVSPYRLAAHLTSAFAIYATLVWTTLSVAFPHPPALTAGSPAARAAAA